MVRPCAEWQQGPTLSVPDLCVHQLFDLQVGRDPDAVAVVFGDRQLTYREFDNQTNQLAHRLVELGVGVESIVVVCLPRSVELVAALLAIVKAGGAYLPIDPDWPEARKRLVLEELGPQPVVIADPAATVELGDDIRLVDPRDPTLGGYPIEHPEWAHHTTGQLAYVNFTSGSTGQPKGVMIEHRGILRLLDPGAPWSMGPGDRILHLAPAAFDATTLEVWLPLLSGATLALAPAGPLSLEALASLIQEQRVSAIWLTAGLFDAMADAHPESLARVRRVLTGGDAVDPNSAQAVLDLMPAGHVLINGYGPTEATTFASFHTMWGDSTLPSGPIPIGRPLAATTAQVLNPSGGACQVGVPGELHIGGQGVARGYLNDPELTAEKFIADPHSPGDRLYRTGDLASWNPGGTLAFHGRVDGQMKVNGIRIEPAEIEAAMREHPAVARALAVLRTDDLRHPRLVAYWVPRNGEHVTEYQLRAFLAERLPATMIPAAFMALDSLPLNANGKLDRGSLPAPYSTRWGRRSEKDSWANPQDAPIADRLFEAWSHALGHNNFDVDDHFVMVGGNSLVATRLVSDLDRRYALSLPITFPLLYPTIREQSTFLASPGSEPIARSCLVTLQNEGDRAPLYLVHGWSGGLFHMLPLARAFAPHRPVIGLQGGDLESWISVDEIANFWAERILARHTNGPIHLAGYSAGGWYAHALAGALLSRGAQLGFVGVLDSEPLAPMPWRLQWTLLGPRVRKTANRVARVAMPSDGRSPRKVLTAGWKRRLEAREASKVAEEDAMVIALRERNPQRIPLAIDLFCASYHEAFMRTAWAYYASQGVRSHPMLDTHEDFIRPEFASEVAAAIELSLSGFN